MKIQIETTSNGYILYEKQDDKVIKHTYTDEQTHELLYHVLYLIGPNESRYSDERLFVGYLPGDKYEGEFTEKVKETIDRIKYFVDKDSAE